MPGQLNQFGPQAIVILIINTEETLALKLTQQQIGGTFRNGEFINNSRRAARTNLGDKIENIDGAGERRNFG